MPPRGNDMRTASGLPLPQLFTGFLRVFFPGAEDLLQRPHKPAGRLCSRLKNRFVPDM